jgi:hypothetical protein
MLYAVFLAIAASSLQATTLLSQQGSPRPGLCELRYHMSLETLWHPSFQRLPR